MANGVIIKGNFLRKNRILHWSKETRQLNVETT